MKCLSCLKLQQRIQELERKIFLSYQEAADKIGCSVQTVRKYEREGLLPSFYPNSKYRFHIEDVEWFMRGMMPRKRV